MNWVSTDYSPLDPQSFEKILSLLLRDPQPDPSFDRFTRLASRILDAPISLITILDNDRQFFKSQVGLDEPWASARQTPLSYSFCQYAVKTNEPFVVEDARIDPLVQNSPAVEELDVVAYLGIPLAVSNEHILGTLCVIDKEPRQWKQVDIETLQDLAAAVMTEIELRGELLERKRMEKALLYNEQKYQQILDAIQDLILVKGRGSRIIWANKAFCHFYGIDRDRLHQRIDVPQAGFIVTEQDKLNDEFVLEHGETVEIVGESMERRDGVVRYFNTVKAPIFNLQGKAIMSVGVSRDITVRKETENKLQTALAKEQTLNEFKGRFNAMISHEFRNPLATILNSCYLLEQQSDRLSEEKKRKHFERIRLQIDRLVNLLDDILMVNKLEDPTFSINKEALDLNLLCQKVLEELQINTAEHELIFQTTGNVSPIMADKDLMYSAIINLVSNAIKYSPNGGVVSLSLKYKPNHVNLIVKDQGIGIPAEDLKKLYQTFYRAKNVGHISGTGLGLAIVKQVIDIHQASLAVKSQEGQGSTFIISMPL